MKCWTLIVLATEQHRFAESIVLHLQAEREAGQPFEMGPLPNASLCHRTQNCTYEGEHNERHLRETWERTEVLAS